MSNPSKIKWVKLGIVGKGHGLNGTFFISGRDQTIPPKVKTLLVGNKLETARSLTVVNCRMQSGRPVLDCLEVQNRNDVDFLKGQIVWCPRHEIEVQDQNEYIWADLEGRSVVDSQGEMVGKIVEIQNFGASDIVEIDHTDRGRLSLPFVSLYFDMDFTGDQEQIRLLVPLDTFDEVWQK